MKSELKRLAIQKGTPRTDALLHMHGYNSIPPIEQRYTIMCNHARTLESLRDAEKELPVEPDPLATIHDDGHWTHPPGKDPLDQYSKVRRIEVVAKSAYDQLRSICINDRARVKELEGEWSALDQQKSEVINRLDEWAERAMKAESRLRELEGALREALASFKITQHVEDYPADSWPRKAAHLIGEK